MKKTVHLYVRVGTKSIEESTEISMFNSADMESYGYVHIGSAEVDFTPIPQDQLLQRQITVLAKKQQEIQAEADKQVANIQETIKNLLALPAPEVQRTKTGFDAMDEDIPF